MDADAVEFCGDGWNGNGSGDYRGDMSPNILVGEGGAKVNDPH